MRVLVVGSGLSGATVAQQHVEAGDQVTVIEQREHVAGNAHTEELDGQLVHYYGPHIFHTSSESVWEYVRRFGRFDRYTHQVRAVGEDRKIYSLPFSLITFQQAFGVTTPAEAERAIRAETAPYEGESCESVESWCLKNVGPTLYRTLIREYTRKMWGRDPRELPAAIVKRLPVRLDSNVDYFDDRYQGIPEKGYTNLVRNMMEGARVVLGEKGVPERFGEHDRVYYTGPVDELCGYEHGRLEARAISFERYVGESQGCVQLNDCGSSSRTTRTTESWLFQRGVRRPDRIWMVRETPGEGEPAYPVNDRKNSEAYGRYERTCAERFPNLVLVGRMATHKYLDMDQAIGQALKKVREARRPRFSP